MAKRFKFTLTLYIMLFLKINKYQLLLFFQYVKKLAYMFLPIVLTKTLVENG